MQAFQNEQERADYLNRILEIVNADDAEPQIAQDVAAIQTIRRLYAVAVEHDARRDKAVSILASNLSDARECLEITEGIGELLDANERRYAEALAALQESINALAGLESVKREHAHLFPANDDIDENDKD